MCGMGMISKEKHLFYTIFKKIFLIFLLFQYLPQFGIRNSS